MALGCCALCEPLCSCCQRGTNSLDQRDSRCQIYLTHIPSNRYIRRNASEPIINVITQRRFKQTFDIFPFHHIALNQMKDSVAISRETDIRGEDGICLQSCIQLQKSVKVNDESPICFSATGLAQIDKTEVSLTTVKKQGSQGYCSFKQNQDLSVQEYSNVINVRHQLQMD